MTKAERAMRKNAEVTPTGIKARGDPGKANTKTIVVNDSYLGKLKKRIIGTSVVLLAMGNAVALAAVWEPWMVHVAWTLGTGTAITLLALTFSKME